MEPVDRRGLGEVIAWSIGLTFTFVLTLTILLKTGQVNEILVGAFSGQLIALFARGTQSGAERTALRSRPMSNRTLPRGGREPTGKVKTVVDDAPTAPIPDDGKIR